MSGTRIFYERCDDCGFEFYGAPLRTEEFTEDEAHIFPTDGLQCAYCSYIPNSEDAELPAYACKHEQTHARTIAKDGYLSLDGNSHIAAKFVTTQTVCENAVCLKAIEEKTESTPVEGAVAEAHAFADGVCAVCGYVCPHESFANGVCTACGYACAHENFENSVCTACGYTCPHEDFENGVCAVCGYVCPHENKYDAENNQVSSECESIDAWTHKITDCFEVKKYCPDCGIYFEPEMEVYSHRELHIFKNGVCAGCGTKSICPHDLTVLVYDPWLENVIPEFDYAPYDETYHVMGYEYRPYVCCQRCGIIWEDETLPIERVEQLEKHSGHDGKCNICGAPMAPEVEPEQCEHAHTRIVDSWMDCVSEPLDVQTHKVTGTRWSQLYCDDCHQYLGEATVEENVTAIELHYMFPLEEGMFCGFCEYTPSAGDTTPEGGLPAYECPHDMTGERTLIGETFRPVDANSHIASTYRKAQVHCFRCGGVVEEEVAYEDKEGAVAEAHAFADGVCAVCGYACPHENRARRPMAAGCATNTIPLTPGRIGLRAIPGKQDLAWTAGPIWNTTRIPIRTCGTHSFENGVCAGCGTRSICPHDLTVLALRPLAGGHDTGV